MKSDETELELVDENLQCDAKVKIIPQVEITKEGNTYCLYNVKTPDKQIAFNNKEELYAGIGSPGRKLHQFTDLTGDDLFNGIKVFYY